MMQNQDVYKRQDEELLTRLRSGEEEISDYLMEKYKGFVRQKARAMFLIGGETDDLIQEGMIGLFKAVQSYQPDKDASFRTFAGMCIDRQLYSAIQNSNRQKHMPLNLSLIHICNTNRPEDKGTFIVESTCRKPKYVITGIAGKKGFCSINIEKSMMNSEVGFGRKVLQVFEDQGISLSLIHIFRRGRTLLSKRTI